jgi:hypothetical protein
MASTASAVSATLTIPVVMVVFIGLPPGGGRKTSVN